MPCTSGGGRDAGAAAAVLGAVALSMVACGTGTDSPTGPSPTVQPPTTSERDALVAQYNAGGGPNWTNTTNWLSSEPLGTWYGVEAENDRVTKLDLCGPDGNNLHGTIAPELGSLTAATDLRLSNNFLTGTIPSTLGSMTALEILRLSNNALTGTVPSELGSLTNLVELRLHRNRLTGELPQTLMDLPNLRRLRIEDNAGLCAPTDRDFQAWLGTLDEFESDCGAPAQARADSLHPRVPVATSAAARRPPSRRRADSLYPPVPVATAVHGPLGFSGVRSTTRAAGRWLDRFTARLATGPDVSAASCRS